MIIGSGQLAKAFDSYDEANMIIFASGVANSNCQDEAQFEREKKLLVDTIRKHSDKTIIYFSSCALSSHVYPKNRYYRHKSEMERLIMSQTSNYYIFRIPQLFGKLKKHNTLINYLYTKIVQGERFKIYSKAYRYVIEISDVVSFVLAYVKKAESIRTIDVANTYRYSVSEIVKTLEKLTGGTAKYDIIEKVDAYQLDLRDMQSFLRKNNLEYGFSKEYLYTKLNIDQTRINEE